MQLRYTKGQIPRGARPDAEANNAIYLIKNVSFLRATYQVKLLLYRAEQEQRKLILRVPSACKFSDPLRELVSSNKSVLQIQRVK